MLAKVSQILGDPVVAVWPELCNEKHKERRRHAGSGLRVPQTGMRFCQPLNSVCESDVFSAAAKLATRWEHRIRSEVDKTNSPLAPRSTHMDGTRAPVERAALDLC
jgi:hypothetical protein